MYIAIAGNIGSGKTTLAELLANQMGYAIHYEDPAQNPYIEDFYRNMERWAFHMQVYLLNTRLNKMLEIQSQKQNIIQDRTFYEDAEVFAKALNQMGILNERDYNTYRELYQHIMKLITPPDLVIYLKASVATLVKHITIRKRGYEGEIRLDYLRRLNLLYNEWFQSYDLGKKLLINVDELDFHGNEEHLAEIFRRVDGEIHGLFA